MAGKTGGKRDFIAGLSARTGATALIEFLPQRRRLLVLNYHRIGDPFQTPYDSGTFTTSADAFDEQINYLKRHFHMATLEEATESRAVASRGTSVLITFDDGYFDNYALAFPVLRSHGVQGVFFLPTAFVGTGQVPWWDAIAWILKHSRNRAIRLQYPEPVHFDLDKEPVLRVIEKVLAVCKRPEVRTESLIANLETASECPRPAAGAERCFLSWDEAREMNASGMMFGSHTHTHEILAKIPPARQLEELTTSRRIMERELSQPVRALAYPVGAASAFSSSTIAMAKQAGYTAAFSFYGGTNSPERLEPFNIRRIGVSDPTLSRLRLQTALVAVTGSYWF